MLYHKKGDLLKSDCTVIMHQANCFKTMGAGIAKSIAKLYPEANKVDKEYKASPKNRLGNFSHAVIDDGPTVVNLYGQFGFGVGKVQTKYDKLESAIDKFLNYAKENNVNLSKVGVPYKMGCGLAGGDWDIVLKILNRQSEKHDVDIYIHKLWK